jgi:hypothetical protein
VSGTTPIDVSTRTPRPAEPERIQADCCAAVALGWQVAELYDDALQAHRHDDAAAPAAGVRLDGEAQPCQDLPGTGKLRAGEKLQLRLGQVEQGLLRLSASTGDEGLRDLLGEVRGLFKNGRALKLVDDGSAPDLVNNEALPDMLRSLHVNLLSALTVADFRLGKAYGLGRALCDVCRESQPDEELTEHFAPKHLNKLISWCSDLKSVLPDHAGQSVADSLRRWRNWARNRPWSRVDRAEFDQRLRRQGERWRSVLTGEKAPRDLLTPKTYIQAGEELLADAAAVGWGFVKKFWPAVILATALLIGGIYYLLQGSGGSSIVGGLAAIAASLGITWKTATPALTNLGRQLSDPLWGAELDAAITAAITDPIVPAGGDAQLEVAELEKTPPVSHAIDQRMARKAARQVWKRLDRSTKASALAGHSTFRRIAYRFPVRRSRRSPTPFMPRDAYLSLVQSMLEERIASKRLETSAVTEDELYAQFGPNDWEWLKSGVQACLTRLTGKHSFGTTPEEHEMSEDVVVVLFGDWATGTPGARRLSSAIRKRLGESTGERHLIHLGDVYYCGLPDEYHSRFLECWPAAGLDGVTSWNLNGNHDMYSGGKGYFGLVSGDQSLLGTGAEMFAHQHGTSFFRLSNEDWQIIALDTAYLDKDLAPEQLPKFKEWVGVDGIDGASHIGAAPQRKTILLSHHQLGSAHDQRSVGSGIRDETDAARKSGRIHAWFWGHEHRCILYEDYLNVKCPVCIGNGGVPELLSRGVFTLSGGFQMIKNALSSTVAFAQHPFVRAPRVAYEPEPQENPDGLKWEPRGFVVIELKGAGGTALYVDEDGNEEPIRSFGS